MAARRASDIESALARKGFVLNAQGDHRYLTLVVEGRRTTVRTRLSHGRKDYGDDLLSAVQSQLRLAQKRELLELIDCSLTGEDYVGLLRQQGILP